MNFPKILSQTSNWVLLDKPAGWLSVPSRLGRKDERPCVGYWLEEQMGTQIYPVHRLDLEVSGIMIYGLSDQFHRWGNDLFENHKVEKTYQAFTAVPSDIPVGIEQRWEGLIVRGKKRSFFAGHGKPSVTLATIERVEAERAVWNLKPQTGRPHQLRLDLSSRRAPICGDQLYGSLVEWPADGIALRAVQLNFKNASGFEDWELKELYQVAGFGV